MSYVWRFIDAEAIIKDGTIILKEVHTFENEQFVAISHTWTKELEDWLKDINAAGEGSETYCEKIAKGSKAVKSMKTDNEIGLSQL